MKLMKYFLSVLISLIFSINVAIAEKWDMALAYGAGNFHSANATEFAKNVTEKSGGKLTIVTHPGGSLFKGGEIFRAVRTGQAQMGERFMSALGKVDPILEIDSQPFLATSYDDAMKLYQASKPARKTEELHLRAPSIPSRREPLAEDNGHRRWLRQTKN